MEKRKMIWRRRFLTLDRYMAGDFKRLFGWALGGTVAIFLIICIVGYIFFGWNPLHAFIQTSNPNDISEKLAPMMQFWEGSLIFIANIFGLVVLNGVVLTLLVNWLSSRRERHDNGEARYEYVFSRPFSLIIGGHQIAAALTKDLIAENKDEFIVVQTERPAAEVRKEIYSQIADADKERVIIYSGSRTSWFELEELHIDAARQVFIVGEPFSIDGTSHDALNMECWGLICSHIKKSADGRRIPCHVMFEYQSTFTAFQFSDLEDQLNQLFYFIPFSIYENWAQKVLAPETAEDKATYASLDGSRTGADSHQRVHLIVAGMSKMGVALGIEAAQTAHYPNFANDATGRPRTLITFIDRNARREMLYLMGRFPVLFQLVRWRYVKAPDDIVPGENKAEWNIYDSSEAITRRENSAYPWHDPIKDVDFGSPYYGGYLGEYLTDIDFEFIEGDIALPSVRKYLADACADCSTDTGIPASITTIAVAFPISVEAMSAALYFPSSVYENVRQIWVQQGRSGALVDTLRAGETGADYSRYDKLRPFGMIESCDYLHRMADITPKLINYAYNVGAVRFCKEYEESPDRFMQSVNEMWNAMSNSGGKTVMAQRWSNRYAASSFSLKERLAGEAGFTAAMTEILASVEHNRWVMEQLLTGMRPTDSDEERPVTKQRKGELKMRGIHTDIVSNEMLSPGSKEYDMSIAGIIPVALEISRKYRDNGKIHTEASGD